MNILTGSKNQFHFQVILIYLFLMNLLDETFNEKNPRTVCFNGVNLVSVVILSKFHMHFFFSFSLLTFNIFLADQFSRGALNIIFHVIFLRRFDSFILLIFQGKVNLALSDMHFRVLSGVSDPHDTPLLPQRDLNYML